MKTEVSSDLRVSRGDVMYRNELQILDVASQPPITIAETTAHCRRRAELMTAMSYGSQLLR